MDCGQDIDLHRLELRYSGARLIDSRAIERLARSIDQCGQLNPCIAVADAEHLVLIDGYRRIAALRRLGRDTASVAEWQCDLAQALLHVLARTAQSRPFAAIEEAFLVRELVQGFKLSQRDVASRSGRDVSWVQRRLQLLVALPDPLLDAVRQGRLATWAATRIFAPLARANAEHAESLLAALNTTPLSTRELKLWFGHYQRGSRATRERLVAHPRLFLDSLKARAAEQTSERLVAGPEGLALADLKRLETLLHDVRRRLAVLTDPVLEPLAAVGARVTSAWRAFQHELTRLIHDDTERNPQRGTHPESAGAQPARVEPPLKALA